MKDMNNNERGRLTGMPGTETTVTLYPQRLTARLRNSIIRMIESRAITGGWSSQARRLAENLAEKYGIQCSITHHYRGLRIVGLTEEAAPHIAEVVHADWTAWVLENPEYRNGYYKNGYDNAMHSIKNLDNNFYCNIHDKVSISKVVEILAEHTTQEAKDKSKRVADLLRGTEPINIITF